MSNAHTQRFPVDAERHVIASAFCDLDWLATARHELEPRHFSEPTHRILWEAVLATYADGAPADEISVLEHLRRDGNVDTVGGVAGINSITSTLYSPNPNVLRWQEQVLEGHKLRTLSSALERLKQMSDASVVSAEEIAREASAIADQAGPRRKPGDSGPQRFDWRQMLAFDPKQDPDCIFGDRWLSRGHSAMFIAGTGVGKSTFINGAACHWALGKDYFGLKPKVGPLRTLVIQSENDQSDTAETIQGALHGMGIPLSSETADQIGERVVFYRESVRTGEAFGKLLRGLILDHRADVTVIDPVLGFSGIDMTKNDQLSHWLRGILQPIITETRTLLINVHHTNKPRPVSESAVLNFDNMAYLGGGGAELANWHRSTLSLFKDPTPDGEDEQPHYSLIAGKRGGRSGLTDSQGNYTRVVRLRHSRTPGIVRWERRTDDLAIPAASPTPSKSPSKAFGQGRGGPTLPA